MNLDTSTVAIIGYILGVGGVATLIIQWMRGAFSGQDKAGTKKIVAESEDTSASAAERRANVETKLSDGALRWAEKLGTELEKSRLQIEKQEEELNKTWTQLREAQKEVDKMTMILENMKSIMQAERENCEKITQELMLLKDKCEKNAGNQ